MPKKAKEAAKLPPAEAIPTAKPFVEQLKKDKERVGRAKQAAIADGKFNKYDGKYRLSLKHLKRTQRKLKAELTRVHKSYALSQARAAKAAEAAKSTEAPAE